MPQSVVVHVGHGADVARQIPRTAQGLISLESLPSRGFRSFIASRNLNFSRYGPTYQKPTPGAAPRQIRHQPKTSNQLCDITDLSRGANIYFPVYVDGAGLSVGDLHFSQGDGEMTTHGMSCSCCSRVKLPGNNQHASTAPRAAAGRPWMISH